MKIVHFSLMFLAESKLSSFWPLIDLSGDSMVKNLPAKMQIHSLGREDSLEKGMATHSSILAWEIIDREAWKAIVHGIAKESDNVLATKQQHIH